MPTPRLLILDCDGVLVDSEPIDVRVDAQVLAHLGWPLGEGDIVDRFVGRTHEYMVREIEAFLGRPLEDGWEDQFTPMYRAAFDAELAPVEGIVEALDRIDIRACVASSASLEKIERSLRLCGLYDRFDGRIFSSAQVANGKPAPDLFLFAAACMGTQPRDAVVVEDSPFGIEAALAAGMRVLAYVGGLVLTDRLQRADAQCHTSTSNHPSPSRSIVFGGAAETSGRVAMAGRAGQPIWED